MVVHELHVNERTMLEVASLAGSSRLTIISEAHSSDFVAELIFDPL
jgi:hypothetical protein